MNFFHRSVKKDLVQIFACLSLLMAFSLHSSGQSEYLFRSTSTAPKERTIDLIHQLTLDEKISLFGYNSPGVERLGIPRYNWWNEALHGVARAGKATVYPQAIAMAATFNDSLINKVAEAISVEARAKNNLAIKQDNRVQYMGLSFWSPNINIFRDPRWGRGQETYGEDPYLTSCMGLAFVKGIQGEDPNYLRASAGAKHFAAHSGPEAGRHTFNAKVSKADLRNTYLYAFKKLVDAGVESIMCGYNRLNDEPCCTGKTLLNDILREEWHFQGHVVTDCWALEDIWLRHKVMNNSVEVAAAAIKAGINLDCSNMLQDDLRKAYEDGLITEDEIDRALAPQLMTLFKLGFFDKPEESPFNKLGEKDINNTNHVELARLVAQQSMVLLKNDNDLLPLRKSDYKSMLVTGANAASMDALLGNYHGVSSNMVTFVEGIVEAAGPAISVQYDLGCNYTDTTRFGGLWVSENSDVTVAVIGLTPVYEGEEGDAFLAPHGGDKNDLSLPAAHIEFMKALRARHNKPVIAVITAGSAVDVKAIEPYADAIIFAWYSGEQGGNALADILFGKTSPSGRLPITFYRSFDDLPPYEDYSMKGRTYRYYEGEVQYPFGFGLSYTAFNYSWNAIPKKRYSAKDTVIFEINLKNIGKMDGNEVAQAYIQYPQGKNMPLKELKAFKNVFVTKNSTVTVTMRVPVSELQKWNEEKDGWDILKGEYKIILGGHSTDRRLEASFRVK